jgi:DUF1680 family protein
MEIEYQTFMDADGKEVQAVAKETFEKTTAELDAKLAELNNKLSSREYDIGNIKKKFSELTEEERNKMSQENQEIMKAKEEMAGKLDKIEKERTEEYIDMFSSRFTRDEEQIKQIKSNLDRILLTEEEKGTLSLKQQIELKTKYAYNLLGIEKPNVLNTSSQYVQAEAPKKDFSSTDDGLRLSAQMLGLTVEQYKEKYNLK